MIAKKERTIYNLANILSISRIFATIPLIICFENFVNDEKYIYYSIFIIIYIIISDILDGYFARLSDCVTDFGKIIDPIADKVCFMVVLIYLIDKYYHSSYIINIFLIFYILLSIRDLILITLNIYNMIYKKHVSQANNSGKLFIFLSSIMVVLFIYDINETMALLFYAASVITMIFSTILYIAEYKNVRNK